MAITLNGTTGITTPALDSVAPFSSADMPAGSVLQVAQARKTDTSWSTTSGSFVPVTGLSVTITPTSTSSKFLVFASVAVGANWWQTAGGYFSIQSSATGSIAGDNNSVWVFQYGADSVNTTQETMQWAEEGMDTPNTLSPVTYSVSLAANAGYALFVNRSYYDATKRGNSWITVMEIAA
jgi:hypothetical protein